MEALREQVAYLQGVIATRDQELALRAEDIRWRDATPEREQQLTAIFADRLRELEAPREPPAAPKTVEEEPEASEPRPDAPGPRTPPQRERGWWRRIIGG